MKLNVEAYRRILAELGRAHREASDETPELSDRLTQDVLRRVRLGKGGSPRAGSYREPERVAGLVARLALGGAALATVCLALFLSGPSLNSALTAQQLESLLATDGSVALFLPPLPGEGQDGGPNPLGPADPLNPAFPSFFPEPHAPQDDAGRRPAQEVA